MGATGGDGAGRPGPSAPALVGRGRELASLLELLGRSPSTAVIEGEAGIGKTRLVSELVTHSALAEHGVVVGTCPRIREPFPLGPVIEAVQGLADELSAARLSPVVGALRPLLPELASLFPPRPEPLDDRMAERHRVFRGLVALLRALGPAVLVLEDVHWADRQTVDFLSYLLSSAPPELSVLVTFRGDEVDAAFRTVTAKLPPHVGHAHVVLRPFDADDTARFAGALLGLDRVSRRFASHLCTRAEGVPLVIEELLALLRARGSLVRQGGTWARKAIDDLDVPAGVRDPVLERFQRLDAAARAVVEAAAVLQAQTPMSVLVAAATVTAEQAAVGARQAIDSGLLTAGGDDVGFRHTLAAQAVYEAIPQSRRQQLHARAVTAFEGLDSVPLGQRAHHLRQAGRLAEWVRAAEEAADRAVELGHDDEAARLLEEALRDAPLGAEQHGRLVVKLGRATLNGLHPAGHVVELLSDALDHDLARPLRGEALLQRALLAGRTGADSRRRRQLYAAAVNELDEPELKAQAMVPLAFPIVAGTPLSECRDWLDRVRKILPDIEDPTFEVWLLGKVAMVLASLGDPDWRSLTERIVEQTHGSPRRRRELNAYDSLGLESCYVGELETADRLLRAGLSGAERYEFEGLELRMRSAMALVAYCRGEWDGLIGTAEELSDRLADHREYRADAEAVVGCLALTHGASEPAMARLDRLSRQVEEHGGVDLLPIPAAAAIRGRVGRGENEAALAAAVHLASVLEAVPFQASFPRALPALAAAFVAAGQVREAGDLVTRWGARAHGLDAPLAPAALAHADGIVELASDRPDRAAPLLSDAARAYERIGCRYEAVQAREHAGSALLRSGRTQPGAEELRAALAGYQRLGASWDLDRASRAARDHKVSVPARHRGGRRGYGSDLSPRQREVAELAAGGRTNQEIAAELFLSVKTVERHLGAAMRKLDVSSRRSLAQRLDPTASQG